MSAQNFSVLDRYVAKINELPKISPGERYFVDLIDVFKAGNVERAYSIMQQLEALAPGTVLSFWLAITAINSNRPRDAVEALERLDPNSIYVDCNECYWWAVSMAYHMVGSHEQELKAAQMAHKQFPQEWQPLHDKIMALSAMGRLDDVHQVLEESYARPLTDYWWPANLMMEAGSQFLRHGYAEAAVEMNERALSWLRERPWEDLSDDMKMNLAWTLIFTGNLKEAESVLRELLGSNPEYLVFNYLNNLGALGVAVAMQGDREEALRIDEQLKNWDEPFSMGEHTRWRASIYANLGDKDRAVSLLQEARRQGYSYAMLYCRPSLKPI